MHWKSIFHRRRRDAEIDEELAAHLRMAIQDRIAQGQSPADARAAARREFGNRALVFETTRDVWIWTALEQIFQDLRAAARILTKSPAFSASAVLLVALGIGSNTTIYSVLHGIMTKPMPGVQADGLVSLGVLTHGKMDDPGNSYPNYLDYVAQTQTLRPLLARGFERFTVTIGKATYGLRGALITRNYFDTVGVRLVKGRAFTADEARAEAALTAVISYQLWQEQFQGAADIFGRTLLLNGRAATIVGVAPARFRGVQMAERHDIWVPILPYCRIQGTEKQLYTREFRRSDSIGIEMIGRLAPGVSLAAARAEFDTISRRLAGAYPEANKDTTVLLEPYSALGPGIQQVRIFRNIIAVVSLLALLIVCANVANLMLARSVARQREMAVRQSIGASRLRILRMLVAEGLVLSLAAWIAAWCFAIWASQAVLRLLPTPHGMRIEVDVAPDWNVAVYALSLAALSAVAFTLAPALRAWRQDLLPWLKAGEHSVAQGRSTLACGLVIAQLALCVVLLTGAGLANRSLYLIETVHHVGDDQHLLLITVNTAAAAENKDQNLALLDHLRERVRAVPGVLVASWARAVPPNSWVSAPVQAADGRDPIPADANLVGPDYLRAVDIAPMLGRDLTLADRAGSAPTAVINQDLANLVSPGASPIGQTIRIGAAAQPVEIVAVVPNSVFTGMRPSKRHNFMFLAERQRAAAPGEVTLHVRYAGSLDAIAPALRAAIWETDVRVAVAYTRTLAVQFEELNGHAVMIASLLGMFAVAALVLAAMGLYAVIAFHASKRTREFGVRIALGASSTQIHRAVLQEGLLLAGAGLAIGFALSVAGASASKAALFGVTPTDLPTYAAVFALLAVVTLSACHLPARRAARIDPMQALRQE